MYVEKCINVTIPQTEPAVPRIGLILLNTDFTSERDFSQQALTHELEFDCYVNRIHFENPMTVKSLAKMVDELGSVAADILPDSELDAMVFNCTSASAILGDEAVSEAISRAKPNSPVLTTASASIAHILQANHRKVSVLAPYSAEVSRKLVDYFERGGLDILSLSYMGIEDDRDVARLDSRAILDAACAAVEPGAEALFISCTATRAVEILPEIEKACGVPVYSSNYCSFWQAMGTIGLA